jgi:hypothetical protein
LGGRWYIDGIWKTGISDTEKGVIYPAIKYYKKFPSKQQVQSLSKFIQSGF